MATDQEEEPWLTSIVSASSVTGKLDKLIEAIKGFSKDRINKIETAGVNGFHCAVIFSNLAAVKILLDSGADMNILNGRGFSPLYLATGRCANHDVATVLLKKSEVNVNIPNHDGVTPLHGAAFYQKPDMIRLLIRHGADVNQKSKDGDRPIDLAMVFSHMPTISALLYTRCVECGAQPATGLKTCGQCQGPLYCGKECQSKQWREGHKRECEGYVLAYPHTFRSSNNGLLSAVHYKNMTLKTSSTDDMEKRAKDMTHNSRFIVKVQLQLNTGLGGSDSEKMMVYNKKRSLTMLISPINQERSFINLSKKIRSDGYMGLKAFFWAELPDTPELKMKISYKLFAPFQQW